MYPMRQTWCGSRVSHHCFYVDLSDSICCVLGNPEARSEMLDRNIDISVYSQLQNQCAVNNLWFWHQSLLPTDSVYKKKEKKGRAKIRTRVRHPSFMFNHSSDGLIGMLMRLARCLLDQFGLKDTTPACQLRIRNGINLPSPFAAHQLLQIALPLPNLVSGRVRSAGRLRRSTFAQTQAHHTSLSQLSGPVAFTAPQRSY